VAKRELRGQLLELEAGALIAAGVRFADLYGRWLAGAA
jgi:hypothetical protein